MTQFVPFFVSVLKFMSRLVFALHSRIFWITSLIWCNPMTGRLCLEIVYKGLHPFVCISLFLSPNSLCLSLNFNKVFQIFLKLCFNWFKPCSSGKTVTVRSVGRYFWCRWTRIESPLSDRRYHWSGRKMAKTTRGRAIKFKIWWRTEISTQPENHR